MAYVNTILFAYMLDPASWSVRQSCTAENLFWIYAWIHWGEVDKYTTSVLIRFSWMKNQQSLPDKSGGMSSCASKADWLFGNKIWTAVRFHLLSQKWLSNHIAPLELSTSLPTSSMSSSKDCLSAAPAYFVHASARRPFFAVSSVFSCFPREGSRTLGRVRRKEIFVQRRPLCLSVCGL